MRARGLPSRARSRGGRRYDRGHGIRSSAGAGSSVVSENAVHRWWEENSELDRVVETVRLKLDRGVLSEAGASLGRLATILEGHFATEEDLYFPLVERAAPTNAERVAAARSGHEKLRDALEGLQVLVENGDLASARRALAALLHGLQIHEVEEGKLIAELQRLSKA